LSFEFEYSIQLWEKMPWTVLNMQMSMLKTYQFKTHCKGDSHSSKTAHIILPGLMIIQRWTSLRLQAKWYSNSLNCIMLV